MTDSSPRNPTPGLARFALRVALFLLPLAVGAMALFLVPVSRGFVWDFVRGDSSGQGPWIHARLTASPVPIDVAFVGTSRTLLGVGDETISRALAKAGRPRHVTNLGYPRSGRNQHYVIARDLLASRKVRHLFVEVGNDEHRGSHPMFGYVACADDILDAPIVPDLYYIQDLYHGMSTRLAGTRHDLLGLPDPIPKADVDPHGFRRWVGDGLASRDDLNAAWTRRHARAEARGAPRGLRTRRPRFYVRAIGELAARHGTQVHFLYLPSYGWPWAELGYRALYEELGDVWIPPEEIFRDPACWLDPYHLTAEGNARLSAWIATRLESVD